MFDRTNGPTVRTNFNQPDPTGKTGVYNTAFIQAGSVPSARLNFATDASNADTLAIGGKTFKFLTTLIAADTTVQVKRGTSAAATLAALVKAINGTVSAAEWVEASTPFAKTIVADAVDATDLRIRWATARGGLPLAGVSGSIALSESLTPAASIWNCANLNVTGRAPSTGQACADSFVVTAQMLVAGAASLPFLIELPFAPTFFQVYLTSSTGVLRSLNEAVTISGNALSFPMAGGGSPNAQSGDILSFFAVA